MQSFWTDMTKDINFDMLLMLLQACTHVGLWNTSKSREESGSQHAPLQQSLTPQSLSHLDFKSLPFRCDVKMLIICSYSDTSYLCDICMIYVFINENTQV